MQVVQLYLMLSSVLFALGLAGLMINRHNVIVMLMCIELILLAVNTNFIAFSSYLSDIAGQVFVFFILTVAAAEAAIGLAIVMLIYRSRHNVDAAKLHQLKG